MALFKKKGDTAATESSEDGAGGKKSKKKLLLIVVGVVVVLAAGGFFVLGGGKATAGTEPAPEPGSIVKLDPITMNLSDGHYLKIGIALQLQKGTGGKSETTTVDGAKALDAAISLLGDRTYAQLAAPGGREAAKAQLSQAVAQRYPHEVMGIYFTEFAMQ